MKGVAASHHRINTSSVFGSLCILSTILFAIFEFFKSVITFLLGIPKPVGVPAHKILDIVAFIQIRVEGAGKDLALIEEEISLALFFSPKIGVALCSLAERLEHGIQHVSVDGD